jgi:hypothetical protein
MTILEMDVHRRARRGKRSSRRNGVWKRNDVHLRIRHGAGLFLSRFYTVVKPSECSEFLCHNRCLHNAMIQKCDNLFCGRVLVVNDHKVFRSV